MPRYLKYVIDKGRRVVRARRRRRRQALPSRRRFLIQAIALLGGGLLLARHLVRESSGLPLVNRLPLRPPSAAANDARFRASCIRCGLCGTVCENGCIRFFGLDEGKWGALTPYIDARQRSCTLCMKCTQICPSGALTPLTHDLQTIAANVHMGTAVVDPDRCLSYLGRICGYCHDACPLPQKAIRLTPPAKPVVLADGCVGCGRCVEFCPQTPTAIDVRRVPA